MIYHVRIEKLVIFPNRFYPELGTPIKTLYGTINGVPVPVLIPPGIPITKPSIRDYLLSKRDEILATYAVKLEQQPIDNHDVDMEFDWIVD